MIVFITGASAGFGAAMARTFVKHGHQVIISGRRADRLQDLADELGQAALPFIIDVSDKQSINAAIAGLPEDWRDIDVLVNNAGLALGTAPPAASAERAERVTLSRATPPAGTSMARVVE